MLGIRLSAIGGAPSIACAVGTGALDEHPNTVTAPLSRSNTATQEPDFEKPVGKRVTRYLIRAFMIINCQRLQTFSVSIALSMPAMPPAGTPSFMLNICGCFRVVVLLSIIVVFSTIATFDGVVVAFATPRADWLGG